jgi:hypothetical protein
VIAAAALLQGCIEYVPVQTAAQQPPPPAPPGAPAAAQPSPLERLVGPIALYPDPLLALVLPASTVPSDISAARAYLVQYGDLSRLDSQPWDPSVRALARYPSVIQWLDENQEWTRALGQAFLDSPRDVMDAIQRLRREAVASGALASNFLQQEYSEDGQTGILPGQADGLYVPVYDSDAYFWGGNAEITYSGPYPVGPWLSYWPDWIGFGLWTGGWDYWHGGGTWHPPHVDHRHPPPGMHPWPQPVHPRKPTEAAAGRSQNYGPAPHPMRGATVSAGHSAGASHFAPASHFEGSHASAPASAPASPSSSTSSQDSKNH